MPDLINVKVTNQNHDDIIYAPHGTYNQAQQTITLHPTGRNITQTPQQGPYYYIDSKVSLNEIVKVTYGGPGSGGDMIFLVA